MTNWIFYPRLPPALRHKTGKTEKSWANAWINSHECHRRSKYCINISAELHMLDVERCLLLPDDAIRPPDEATHMGYDGDWKELRHDDHSIIPSQWIEEKCEVLSPQWVSTEVTELYRVHNYRKFYVFHFDNRHSILVTEASASNSGKFHPFKALVLLRWHRELCCYSKVCTSFAKNSHSNLENSVNHIPRKVCGFWVCSSRSVNTIFHRNFLRSFLKSRVPWCLTLKFRSKNVNKSSSPINSVCEADKSKQKSIRTRTMCHIPVSKLAMRYFRSLFLPR